MKVYFGSYTWFVLFLVTFGIITWLLGLPWYAVAILAVGMVGLRLGASLWIRRQERDRAA